MLLSEQRVHNLDMLMARQMVSRSGLSAPSLDDTSIGGSGRESFEFAVIKSRRSALAPEMFSVK